MIHHMIKLISHTHTYNTYSLDVYFYSREELIGWGRDVMIRTEFYFINSLN